MRYNIETQNNGQNDGNTKDNIMAVLQVNDAKRHKHGPGAESSTRNATALGVTTPSSSLTQVKRAQVPTDPVGRPSPRNVHAPAIG